MATRDIWVDFNNVDPDTGWVDTLKFFAEPGVEVAYGGTLLAGDAEGTTCEGDVLGIGTDGVVKLALNLDTMRHPSERVASTPACR